jgi:hypothetical protein
MERKIVMRASAGEGKGYRSMSSHSSVAKKLSGAATT